MSESLITSINKVLDPHPIPPVTQQQLLLDTEDPWDEWYNGRRYTGPNTKQPTYGKQTTYKPYVYTPPRKVAVLHPDGAKEEYTIPSEGNGWFDIAKTVWPVTNDVIQIPVEHCDFTYDSPAFNACVYTATGDYLQARWGRRLDESDRRWLASHPLSTDGGVPQEYTATCVDQLVQPYGMRVSRVRLRRGSLVLGDSVMAWIQALGCNPFALADRSTSNAEAAERMGITLEQADALWRVEFHDDPLPCSIVGERGWSSGNGVSTGAGGGHARYLAPRAHAGDWFISLQLDTASNVTHLVAPPNPEYVPRKGRPILQLALVTGPDKLRIADKKNGVWCRIGEDNIPVIRVSSPVSNLPEQDEVPEQLLSDEGYCAMCSQPIEDNTSLGLDVCLPCLDDAWHDYNCPHCKAKFSVVGAPFPIAYDEDNYDWECPECRQIVQVPTQFDASMDQQDALLQEISEVAFSLIQPVPSTLPPRDLEDGEGDWWI